MKRHPLCLPVFSDYAVYRLERHSNSSHACPEPIDTINVSAQRESRFSPTPSRRTYHLRQDKTKSAPL